MRDTEAARGGACTKTAIKTAGFCIGIAWSVWGSSGWVPRHFVFARENSTRLRNNWSFCLVFLLKAIVYDCSIQHDPPPAFTRPPPHTHPLVFLCVRAHYPAAQQHKTHAKKGARNKRSTAQTKAPNVRTHQNEALITVALTNLLLNNVPTLSA